MGAVATVGKAEGHGVEDGELRGTVGPVQSLSRALIGEQSMRTYSLTYLKTGQSIALRIGQPTLVGRSHECVLRIRGNFASRRHCELSVSEQQVTVRDLGSRNGTLVNQVPIEGIRELKHGDEIRIGPAVFLLVVRDAASALESAQHDTSDTNFPDVTKETADDDDAAFLSLLRELKALRDGDSAAASNGPLPESTAETNDPHGGSGEPLAVQGSEAPADDLARSAERSQAFPSSAESARNAIEKHFRRRL